MTEYDKNVDAFGRRWLVEHPDQFDLRTLDPASFITLYESHDNGWDPSYSYGEEHHEIGLVVPVLGDGERRICLQSGEDMNFGTILQAIVAEANRPALTPAELAEAQVATLVTRCKGLEEQLLKAVEERVALEREHSTLKHGVKMQDELWKMLRMIHRELDLWFSAEVNQDRVSFKVNVQRPAQEAT